MQVKLLADEDAARGTGLSESVPSWLAKNAAEAEQMKALLDEKEVPTMIEHEISDPFGVPAVSCGISILVAEERQCEASELAARRRNCWSEVIGQREEDDDGEDDFDDLDEDDEDEFDDDYDDEDDEFDDDEGMDDDLFGDEEEPDEP
jgi:hypothetical protein